MARLAALIVVAALLVGCGGEQPTRESQTVPEQKQPPAAAVALSAPSPDEIAAVQEARKMRVEMETEKGAMLLELDGAAAPAAVANFLNLVEAGFYDGMPFHRVEAGFVIQAGAPELVGRPPVSYTIPDERSPIAHERGVIAMARLYRGQHMLPNSASTQFYICLRPAPHLDEMGFTAFGRVAEGLDTIDLIAAGDNILRASVLPPAEE
ncbi:MAG: peptidylprolyl isomerase [Armatimonadota bacterium]|nr:MAG: peptidylprolyl isomerase [Armatimonadota bacterium]